MTQSLYQHELDVDQANQGKGTAYDDRVRLRRLGPGNGFPGSILLGPVLLLAFWSIGSATGFIDERILSAPWTVVSTFGELWSDGRLPQGLITSATRAGLGLDIPLSDNVTISANGNTSIRTDLTISGAATVKVGGTF